MSEADAFADSLRASLDDVAAQGRRIDFWWRDDDAVAPSPALDTLLDAAARHDVPLTLAVIPDPAEPALGERFEREAPGITVSQHGFAHRNHAPSGEKAVELGSHRPADVVLDELSAGWRKLESLFGPRLKPVLTPPWNRISDEVAARRGEVGLIGLTTFARMHDDDPACINTHVDVIDWKGGRCFAGYRKMTSVLVEEIDRRSGPDSSPRPEPLGLLTHHLDHDDGVREFLGVFLSVAADHPAVSWPTVDEMFGLDQTPEAVGRVRLPGQAR